MLTCCCPGSSSRARTEGQTPVHFASPAALPHLPNLAPWVPFQDHSIPSLTPHGLGDTHSSLRRWPRSGLSDHATSPGTGGDGLGAAAGALLRTVAGTIRKEVLSPP